MMSEVIRKELLVFALSILHGMGLTFWYDLLRIFRNVVSHGALLLAAEDFLFWLLAAFSTFVFTFQETDGVLRSYVSVGILLGALLYYTAVSRRLVGVVSRVLLYVKKVLGKICGDWKKRIEICVKRAYNRIRFMYCGSIARRGRGHDRKKTEEKAAKQK